MAVYGYARVSTEQQAENGESLAAQRRRVEGKAAAMGSAVAEFFVEEGVSGSVPIAKRPAGSQLLAAARKGDTVIAASLDRMFRSALDALQTIEWFQKRDIGLRFLDLVEGADVVRNGYAKMLLTITAAFAEQERERVRDRVKAVKAHQREKGRYLGGIVPFGYKVATAKGERLLVEDPEQQAIIRRVHRLRARGRSLREIRATIEEKSGKRLSLDALSRITGRQGSG
jgi:DNA invertase Pin-like site-specific DNA recombinase